MKTSKIKSKPDSTAGQPKSGSLHSACSPAELVILRAMNPGHFTTARTLSDVAWPKKGYHGPRRSGRWQAMGAMLHRLAKRGLVFKKISDTNQNRWLITSAGIRERENAENQATASTKPDSCDR